MSDKVMSEMALRIFKDLYSFSGESISDTFMRVAKEFGNTDEQVKLAYDYQIQNIWRPSTPIYLNAGTDHKMFSACWISDIEDSMDSIYDIANTARKIFQHGAGIGIPIGNLREKNADIYEGKGDEDDVSPSGKSSGPVSFLKLFDAVGATTKSGGRARRAAMMCIMQVDHPDIEDFISCKEIDGNLSNMNISVTITDKFMQAIKDNTSISLISPTSKIIVGEIRAQELWDKIVNMSWSTADPGVIFIDTINKFNVMKSLITINCTNPCSEIPGLPFMSCNLSHVNLNSFYKDKEYDFEKLYKTSYDITILMDNLIDKMIFPDDRFKDTVIKYRPLGIGFMGGADILYEMGLPYDSVEGRNFLEECMKIITTASIEASSDLALEKGTFHNYNKVKDDTLKIIKSLITDNKVISKVEKQGLRNITHTTLAPTGCLKSGTLVHSKQGFKPIEQYKEVLSTSTTDSSSDIGNVTLKRYFDQGIADTIKIKTHRGYEIEGTKDHKLRVLDDNQYTWKKLDEIKQNDVVIMKKGFITDNTQTCTDKQSELLGFYMADGWWEVDKKRKRCLSFSLHVSELEYISKLMNESFGHYIPFNARFKQVDGKEYGKIHTNSTPLYKWFDENHCIKHGAHTAFIPDIIMNGSRSNMISFIRGYLQGDGFIRKSGGRIGFKTVSETMGHQLHTLLLGLGFISNYHVDEVMEGETIIIDGRTVNKNYDVHCLLVDTYHSELLFNELYNENKNEHQPFTELVPIFDGERFSGRTHKMQVGNNVCMSKTCYMKNVMVENYNWFVKNDLVLEKVRDVEQFQNVHVHDLEVAQKSHTYIANGFVTHNSTALSVGASYGMEPIFGLVFTKTLVDSGDKYIIANPIFKKKFENESWYSNDLLEKITQNNGSLKGIRGIPKEVRDVFVVAHDIKAKDRIDMQSVLQKHCSTSISSTINLPSTATREDISEIYQYAYQKGLKGVTVYRDGCKKSQPISFSKEKMEVTSNYIRPTKLQATVHTIDTGNGKLYVTVSCHNGKPVEVFISLGKSGQEIHTFTEALGRVISISLQHGTPVAAVIKTLMGINGTNPVWNRFEDTDKKPTQLLSIPDALAKLFKRYYSEEKIEDTSTPVISGSLCPKCQQMSVIQVEGCSVCQNCGNSKCGG